ncbi:MAG TPA: transporter substrate-binding domain-containing protein [Roseateles sp.]|nr:transporter substrate-binding domain-containing protein [Roseateles sp.]
MAQNRALSSAVSGARRHGRRLLAALAVLAGAGAASACEMTVRWNEDPPFSYRGPEGEILGLNIDIMRATLARLGCQAKMVELPWARALAELAAGRLDILPGTLRLPERESYALFSAPGPQSGNRLFLSKAAQARWQVGRLADLRGTGFRLGLQLGVAYGPEFSALEQEDPRFAAGLQRVATRHSLWRMLAAGRLDGVLANDWTGPAEIRQLGLAGQIQASGVLIAHSNASVAFSRKTVTPDFVARFDQASLSLHKDGSLAALRQRYLGTATLTPSARMSAPAARPAPAGP